MIIFLQLHILDDFHDLKGNKFPNQLYCKTTISLKIILKNNILPAKLLHIKKEQKDLIR